MTDLVPPSQTLRVRALKGTAASLGMTVGGQALRFGSNLILTRLLFPEAFGLMALVQVVLAGTELLSDAGITASVMRSEHGDDTRFLNTAWVLQAVRGVLLWGVVCLLAPIFASLYEQPQLRTILPVSGLLLVLMSLQPVKVMIARRHMMLGRLSALTLVAQALGLVGMALLAWWLQSVWALVIGSLIQPALVNIFARLYLPGPPARLEFDRTYAREILSFGKFLFFSTMATYIIKQSDRAVLGGLVSVGLLGVYNIGFMLASLPVMMVSAVTGSVVYPLYRMRHPSESAQNRGHILRARRLVTGAGLSALIGMALIAPWFVDLLYDDRYVLAGSVATLLCAAQVPVVLFDGTMNAVLVKGDSWRFMLMNVTTAVLQLALLAGLATLLDVPGAIAAIGLAPLLSYPLLARFLTRYGNWDPLGDALLLAYGFAGTGFAVWLHLDRIIPLFTATA